MVTCVVDDAAAGDCGQVISYDHDETATIAEGADKADIIIYDNNSGKMAMVMMRMRIEILIITIKKHNQDYNDDNIDHKI